MALPELIQFIVLQEPVEHLVLPAVTVWKPMLNMQLTLSGLLFKPLSNEIWKMGDPQFIGAYVKGADAGRAL
jgi:hypothetical protein